MKASFFSQVSGKGRWCNTFSWNKKIDGSHMRHMQIMSLLVLWRSRYVSVYWETTTCCDLMPRCFVPLPFRLKKEVKEQKEKWVQRFFFFFPAWRLGLSRGNNEELRFDLFPVFAERALRRLRVSVLPYIIPRDRSLIYLSVIFSLPFPLIKTPTMIMFH